MNRREFLQSSFFAGAATVTGSALYAAGGPDLSPVDEKGFRQFIASHHGQVLMVDFWATYCAPCREELPKLVALADGYRSRGVNFVTVSCDEPEQKTQALTFIRQKGAHEPYLIRQADDPDKFAAAIDPKWDGALPALFIYDSNGKQAQSFVGDTSIKVIQSAVDRILASK